MARFDDRDDEELLRLTPKDPDAFAAFYRRHADPVLAYFAARTREPELAADLMAETFAAALIGAPRFRPRKEPAVAWLYTIARRKLIDSQRRRKVEDAARRRLQIEPQWLGDDDLRRIAELVDAGRDPQAMARLARLPDPQKQAVYAHVVQEHGYAEIAEAMACSESVIRQRVSRGLRTLRRSMEGS